jgi:DHA2 family multidrug resistance protein
MSEAAAIPMGAALSLPAARRKVNPWIIAVAVVVPTFMEVLDTTIANVALRYIAGGLSATVTDGAWVITSYLAANAIILPLSGWLSTQLGRRNYFLLSIAVFTIASGLCGAATSLGQLIFFRVLQGLAGGGLQPSSQGVLLDTFPKEKHGVAMTIFGIAALIAPILGPTLGGYITDNFSWRWIFYINLPVGALAFLFSYLVLEDPEYLKAQRTAVKLERRPFDSIGLGLLVTTMVSWEIILSKGQEWDWLDDAFWRVQTLVAVFVLSLGGLIWRELSVANPVVNLRALKERNLALACLIIFCAFGVLYGSTTVLPALLQSLFGYDATRSGLVLSPPGIFAVLLLPVVGGMLSRGVDARLLVAGGLFVMGLGNFWMAHMNLEIAPHQVVWPRVVMIVGLSMIFAPLTVAAYFHTPLSLRAAAVGLYSLLRNEGGSVGASMSGTIQERREQFHSARLVDLIDPLNPEVNHFTDATTAAYLQQTGDPVLSHDMALQSLADVRDQQSAALAYFDCFWVFAVVGWALILLVFLMKPAVAEKGAHVAAE